MPKGNPNPSPATRFGAGQKANPIRMTAAQHELTIKNAEIATKVRHRFLNALHNVVESDALDANALERLTGDILRLLRDAEDRGFGTPQASVDVTTNGKDLPGGIDLTSLSDEELSTLRKVLGSNGRPVA